MNGFRNYNIDSGEERISETWKLFELFELSLISRIFQQLWRFCLKFDLTRTLTRIKKLRVLPKN